MGRDDPSFKKVLKDFLLSILLPMKLTKQGYFNYAEFRRVFISCAIPNPTRFTKPGFPVIDTNDDGLVSIAESLDATYNYMLSDEKNSTALFGLDF